MSLYELRQTNQMSNGRPVTALDDVEWVTADEAFGRHRLCWLCGRHLGIEFDETSGRYRCREVRPACRALWRFYAPSGKTTRYAEDADRIDSMRRFLMDVSGTVGAVH